MLSLTRIALVLLIDIKPSIRRKKLCFCPPIPAGVTKAFSFKSKKSNFLFSLLLTDHRIKEDQWEPAENCHICFQLMTRSKESGWRTWVLKWISLSFGLSLALWRLGFLSGWHFPRSIFWSFYMSASYRRIFPKVLAALFRLFKTFFAILLFTAFSLSYFRPFFLLSFYLFNFQNPFCFFLSACRFLSLICPFHSSLSSSFLSPVNCRIWCRIRRTGV